MNYNTQEVEIVEQAIETASVTELNELELALVGGGIGDPLAA
jgi:hypothetical protein